MSGMIYVRPFGQVGNTVNIIGAGRVAITRPSVGTQSIRIVNAGTDTAFLSFGDSTVTTTITTGMPLLANSTGIFLVPNYITHIAVAGATGTIYFTTGESS